MLEEISRLPEVFRANAAQVRALAGDERAATVWEAAARLTEAAIASAGMESLTLDQAALESGYSVQHLRRMLREGKVSNAGTNREPRIVRCQLPRKPGHFVDGPWLQRASSKTQAARAVIEGDE